MYDYGSAIAKLRKQQGLTQSELGEKLNVSYQAVSKWENNLSQPDLDTILRMSKIFDISVDDFYKIASTDTTLDSEQEEKIDTTMLGVCSSCGRTITKENLGSDADKLLCKACKQKANDAIIQLKREQERQARIAQSEKEINEAKFKTKLTWSFIVGIISAIIVLIGTIWATNGTQIFTSIWIAISFMTMVPQLFWGGSIPFFIECSFCRTFTWPGIIFSFDFDGILFLIGMKLLFWFLGIVLALICGIGSIIISLIISPFTFFFSLRRVLRTRSFFKENI